MPVKMTKIIRFRTEPTIKQVDLILKNTVAAIMPAVNDNVSPAMSLSTIILLLFFAKVVINFLNFVRLLERN